MDLLQIQIINRSGNPLPAYATAHSAGMDLHAFLPEEVELLPMQRILIPTGLFIALPLGYEAQIRPRSGLAIHSGITMLNSPGTIDADYRGEIKVIVINLGDKPFVIRNGDKIAQMVVAAHARVDWQTVEMLDSTDRDTGGFGSTGV
ncbi:MAG: dUTP diphosphatase [Chitinophagales bacterium]